MKVKTLAVGAAASGMAVQAPSAEASRCVPLNSGEGLVGEVVDRERRLPPLVTRMMLPALSTRGLGPLALVSEGMLYVHLRSTLLSVGPLARPVPERWVLPPRAGQLAPD